MFVLIFNEVAEKSMRLFSQPSVNDMPDKRYSFHPFLFISLFLFTSFPFLFFSLSLCLFVFSSIILQYHTGCIVGNLFKGWNHIKLSKYVHLFIFDFHIQYSIFDFKF